MSKKSQLPQMKWNERGRGREREKERGGQDEQNNYESWSFWWPCWSTPAAELSSWPLSSSVLRPSTRPRSAPMLTITPGALAVGESSTNSSSSENHRGPRKTRKGIRAMMMTGKPMAAIVWEMATIIAKTTHWIPINFMIEVRASWPRGSEGLSVRGSRKRKSVLETMPLSSTEAQPTPMKIPAKRARGIVPLYIMLVNKLGWTMVW